MNKDALMNTFTDTSAEAGSGRLQLVTSVVLTMLVAVGVLQGALFDILACVFYGNFTCRTCGTCSCCVTPSPCRRSPW